MMKDKKPSPPVDRTQLVVVCLVIILVVLIGSGICALYANNTHTSKVWDIISQSTTAIVTVFLALIAATRR